MGRPSKLTDTVEKTILNAIRLGLPQRRACALAGISEDTFMEWVRRGQGSDPRPSSRRFVRFAEAVARAKAELQARHLQNIERHAQGVVEFARDAEGQIQFDPKGNPIVTRDIPSSWNASAWLMERRFPEEFGARIEHRTPESSAPLQQLPDDRLLSRMEVLMRRLQERAAHARALGSGTPDSGLGSGSGSGVIDVTPVAKE